MTFLYKDVPIGGYFKEDPFSWQYWKKIKLGRTIVAQPMRGGFTFYTPTGRLPKLPIVFCDADGIWIPDPKTSING